MDRARIARLAAVTLLAALTQACGGAASSLYFSGPGDDGGVSEDGGVLPDGAPAPAPDAAGTDAGPPWSPVCPNALPATGTSCLGENLQCEYGSASWSVSCDAVVQCQNGQWWSYQRIRSTNRVPEFSRVIVYDALDGARDARAMGGARTRLARERADGGRVCGGGGAQRGDAALVELAPQQPSS